jgi:photosystem II stability/assembly factor-like uncharacterized protein
LESAGSGIAGAVTYSKIMSKHKERMRKKKQQKTRSGWLMAAGVIIVLAAGLWIVFSSRQSSKNSIPPISRLSTDDFHSLAFSPVEAETVFFGYHDGLLVSQNGGQDWSPTTLTNTDAMALGVSQSSPQTMYAAGHNVFVKSTDGGETWQSVPADLPGLDIHAFAVDPENPNKVFVYVVSFGLFRSEDGGSSWEALSVTAPTSTHSLTLGEDDQTLYAAAGGAGLWQSQDGGRNWTPVQNLPDNDVIAVAYVRGNGRLYVTTAEPDAGLYYSDDGGQTWVSTGLNDTLLAVAISEFDPDHVIAVNDQGEIFASRDGGISWSNE